MNLINVSKDFYYQPDWFVLSEEDYDSLKKLIFQLFGKNLPAKSEHLFLKNSPIQLPDYSLSDLELLSPSKLSSKSLSLLIKSFKLAKFQDFLSNFILQEKTEKIDRSSKQIIAEKIIKKVTKYCFDRVLSAFKSFNISEIQKPKIQGKFSFLKNYRIFEYSYF